MANLKEIQDFLENLAKTNLFKVKIKTEEIELTVQLKPEVKVMSASESPMMPQMTTIPQVATQATNQQTSEKEGQTKAEESNNYIPIKSPMVGTFYRKPSPDKPAFVEVGQQVKKGDVVCIIEAMKLFNEIESEVDGTIEKILIDDATPVEFDQPLFLVKPL
jgi:acetyl-CoA carboxylase biotin carboxyl carrier protein